MGEPHFEEFVGPGSAYDYVRDELWDNSAEPQSVWLRAGPIAESLVERSLMRVTIPLTRFKGSGTP